MLLEILEVVVVFVKIGILEVVIDLMFFNVVDSFVIFKFCLEWFDLVKFKLDLVVEIELVVLKFFGNNYEFI